MKLTVLVATGFVAFAVIIVFTGTLVFEAQRMWPETYRHAIELPAPRDFVDGVDKPAGMLFSLTLGLFVLVGFVLKGLEPALRKRRFVIGSAAGFLFGSMLSIYAGFMARSVALYFTHFRTEAAISLSGTFLIVQLAGVALSALFAILLLVSFLVPAAERQQPADASFAL